MRTSKRRGSVRTFVIEDSGYALEESHMEPLEFKAKSRKERKREYEEAWADFDRELRVLIEKGEFCIDPKTREVRR